MTRLSRSLAAATLMGALVLTACGDDDATTTRTEGEPDSPSQSEEMESEEMESEEMESEEMESEEMESEEMESEEMDDTSGG